ncbi:stemmadenine O-acetyltransferase-like [Euphorbia lathyris]|uniref:stemmadenine O-acetyltransferase-like n=1 Tax=Euphorbia lathyris TaxID=212925 RepID=UPI0033137B05
MEIEILSKEFIKPSSQSILQKKPHKLSLFDQLTPTTFSTFVVFYPQNDLNSDSNLTFQNLKNSLSETLNLFYPLSGRITDNFHIHHFNEGALFIQAQTKIRMLDLIKHHEIEKLNDLVSFKPFRKEIETNIPLLGVQFTRFSCGGISIGMSASHKQIDGPTGKAFFDSWASICRGNLNGIVHPNLEQASEYFPPRVSLPENHLSLMESLWFTEANYVTRRFVFNGQATATLREKAEVKIKTRPSRIETLSCFIWKCCMKASKACSGSVKPSILVEAVNLRPLTNPPMSNSSTGNVFWWAIAAADPGDEEKTELDELMKMLSEAIAVYKTDYTESLQGSDGFETMSDYCSQLEGLFNLEKPDIFAFTTWCYLGFNKLNFGWGEPFWTGILGRVGPSFRNLTVFIETKDGKGIEAWITLDQERMTFLEHDPEFLAFASPNPTISSL